MIKNFIRCASLLFMFATAINKTDAQNSVLINFGSSSCTGSEPSFSFIKNPFSDSSSALTTCSLANQLSTIFGVFVAYNPKNNKIYVADISSDTATKIWILDVGIPANIMCPSLLSTTPDYSYSYISNNFEFDNNGDLWSFSKYNDSLGQCNIDKFDVTDGAVLNTRILQFASGYYPTSISSGDISILPNGRMFAVLGSNPSKLYEIKNYNTSTNASAVFLDSLPLNCYGIAYLNGALELTGSDFSGKCYYYKYNINSGILDSLQSFQAGQLPIDNTSISPSLGAAKQLVNAVKINENTADLTYDIYVKNLGNVALNNINVSDNLSAVFGAANISNIAVSFVPGDNAANLVLNTNFNGSTDTNLLAPAQDLANQTSGSNSYFFKISVSARVTNLNFAFTYLNFAVTTATLGSSGTQSFINVSDSSNNGPESAVDPNNDGDATEVGENVPTPFTLATLPVKFISVQAALINTTSAIIKWTVAVPAINSDKFDAEYSVDQIHWNIIETIKITNSNQSAYEVTHNNIPQGNIFYRIKETDEDGNYMYSNIVVLNDKNSDESFFIYPNPANNFIIITAKDNSEGQANIILYDAVGKKILSSIMTGNIQQLNTASLPAGAYILKIKTDEKLISRKILINHK